MRASRCSQSGELSFAAMSSAVLSAAGGCLLEVGRPADGTGRCRLAGYRSTLPVALHRPLLQVDDLPLHLAEQRYASELMSRKLSEREV